MARVRVEGAKGRDRAGGEGEREPEDGEALGLVAPGAVAAADRKRKVPFAAVLATAVARSASAFAACAATSGRSAR